MRSTRQPRHERGHRLEHAPVHVLLALAARRQRTHADLERPFRIPGYPVTPLLTIAACVWILIGLPMTTWVIFLAWLAIVMAFYLAYGRRNATLNTYVDPEEIAEPRGKEDQ